MKFVVNLFATLIVKPHMGEKTRLTRKCIHKILSAACFLLGIYGLILLDEMPHYDFSILRLPDDAASRLDWPAITRVEQLPTTGFLQNTNASSSNMDG